MAAQTMDRFISIDSSDVVKALNELVEVSRDGEYGFATYAAHARLPDVKSTLSARSRDCASGAAALQWLVASYGGEREDGGSAAGAMHRGGLSVRTALTTKDDLAVLEEAERGEDAALKKYLDASAKTLPTDVRSVVDRQLRGVQRNREQLKALRERLKATA